MVEKLKEINDDLILKMVRGNAKRKTMQQEEKSEIEYKDRESETDIGNEETRGKGEINRDRERELCKGYSNRTSQIQ